MFLTTDQLVTLTKRKRATDQAEWLAWDQCLERYKADCADGIPHKFVFREDWQTTDLGSGIYVMLKDETISYVGKALDINLRMVSHSRKYWQELLIIPMPEWLPPVHNAQWLKLMEHCAYRQFEPWDNRCPVPWREAIPEWLTQAFIDLDAKYLVEP